MSTAAQIAANQANSKLSSGPKTEAGKLASSRNNFRHGLAGAFTVQSWEKEEEYFELLEGLRAEHQPITPTETLLVESMARHFWLAQRALYLQEFCFHQKAPMVDDGSEQHLALYLRYQTTHDRAFHKCLNELLKLRAQQLRESRGFERECRQNAEECRKQERHQARLQALQAKTKLGEAKAVAKTAAPKLTVHTSSALSNMEAQIQEALAAQAAHEAELHALLQSQHAA